MLTALAETQDFVALLLLRDSTGPSTIVETTQGSVHHPSSAMAALKAEAIRWVSQHNRPLVLDNGIGILSRMQGVLDKAGLYSVAILPLTSGSSPIGAIVFGCRTGPTPFVAMDLPSVTLVGRLLSDAFEQLEFFRWTQANSAVPI